MLSSRGENIGLNFAIPINDAKAMFPRLRAGSVEHGWAGIATAVLSQAGARGLGSPPGGQMVTGLVPDGPAARASIRLGDVLLGLADDPLVPARELQRRVWHLSPGTTIRLRVWRDGVQLEIPVIVGARPR